MPSTSGWNAARALPAQRADLIHVREEIRGIGFAVDSADEFHQQRGLGGGEQAVGDVGHLGRILVDFFSRPES